MRRNDENTVWNFHSFSITQILREINFGDSRSAKSAVFVILESVNFLYLVNFCLQKVQKFIKSPNSEPLNQSIWQGRIVLATKTAIFGFQIWFL